jgi:hypothetical protein
MWRMLIVSAHDVRELVNYFCQAMSQRIHSQPNPGYVLKASVESLQPVQASGEFIVIRWSMEHNHFADLVSLPLCTDHQLHQPTTYQVIESLQPGCSHLSMFNVDFCRYPVSYSSVSSGIDHSNDIRSEYDLTDTVDYSLQYSLPQVMFRMVLSQEEMFQVMLFRKDFADEVLHTRNDLRVTPVGSSEIQSFESYEVQSLIRLESLIRKCDY